MKRHYCHSNSDDVIFLTILDLRCLQQQCKCIYNFVDPSVVLKEHCNYC